MFKPIRDICIYGSNRVISIYSTYVKLIYTYFADFYISYVHQLEIPISQTVKFAPLQTTQKKN